jgi:hypothetical protein
MRTGAFCVVRENAKVLHNGSSDVMTDPRRLVDDRHPAVVRHMVHHVLEMAVATWGDTR